MTDMAAFSAEDLDLLSGLLYRCGVWIGHTDDVEGEKDDEREQAALEDIIARVARLHDEESLTRALARETLGNKAKWHEWADESLDILPDCQRAAKIVLECAGKSDGRDFRAMMLEIAQTVAMAHGEFGSFETGSRFSGFVDKVIAGFSSLTRADKSHPANISPAEDTALSRLSAALGSLG